MKWIRQFQLFLFDFDGLLVNTEHLHFQAYINTLAQRGYVLDWSFAQFCEVAQLNATALREALCIAFPDLETDWSAVYEEKKKAYFNMILSGKVEMMPGAEQLLKELATAGIRRCVVTNASLEQTHVIASQRLILKTIPHWITREDYSRPKPDPECYLQAIALCTQPGDRIIGFEDSLRGLQALGQTSARPVLICPSHHPLLELAVQGGVMHFESLESIPDNFRMT
ncbi:MAG: HAD-superfamily hydrolase [Parachlamydiales bacterium]|nr:HAD-superfamily hydrolase [Parachlamydiales bacterium]